MTDEFAALLTPVSAELPSGTDLEYDPDFASMEKASQGTTEQEFGSTVIEGAPPDWATVRQLSLKLLKRSKDLRIASYLVQSELELRGLVGFRDSLEVIANIVENYWESCFPELDPDDDNDPTIRINALLSLTKPGGVLRQIRSTPIARSRSVGILSLVDSMIARGEIPAPAGMDDPPTLKKVEAVFKSADINELRALQSAVTESIELLKKIEEGFSSQVGMNDSPDFDPLLKELRSIGKAHATWIPQPATTENAVTAASDPEQNDVTTSSLATIPGRAAVVTAVMSISDLELNSRDDAIECLAKIISWFEKNEPSSPLPMLLRRARRLSTMSFLDILRDISPDAITQALIVGGADAEEEEDEVEVKAVTREESSEQNSAARAAPPHDRY